MGRLSEIIWFMNEEKIPDALEIQHRYRYLSITEDLKNMRRKYRAEQRKKEKEGYK